ncbi:uncharacterized protein [Amphiura filiformis]|uniref:uncharacterized protein n=1 Tax=Amphiura filiformis TaxID=82378 RepID=UPI003B21667E
MSLFSYPQKFTMAEGSESSEQDKRNCLQFGDEKEILLAAVPPVDTTKPKFPQPKPSNDQLSTFIFEKFQDTFERQQCKLKYNPPGDGSCFFHSIVDQLVNSAFDALSLRLAAVELAEKLNPSHPLKVDFYCSDKLNFEKMKEPKTYAEGWIIAATASYLERCICLIHMEENTSTMIHCQDDCNDCINPFLIGRINESQHYISLGKYDFKNPTHSGNSPHFGSEYKICMYALN